MSKKKHYCRVFQDDDFDRLGWAYWIATDKNFENVVEAGHTDEYDKEEAKELVRSFARHL